MKTDRHLTFSINSEEYERLENVLKKYPANIEKEINDFLENKGQEILIEKTTYYIPVSVNPSGKMRQQKHAKYNRWYEINFKNLEIDLSNSIRGSRKTHSYYYLYYVASFLSTSDPRKQKTGVGGIDFFEEGAISAYPIVREELLDLLESKIKEEI